MTRLPIAVTPPYTPPFRDAQGQLIEERKGVPFRPAMKSLQERMMGPRDNPTSAHFPLSQLLQMQ